MISKSLKLTTLIFFILNLHASECVFNEHQLSTLVREASKSTDLSMSQVERLSEIFVQKVKFSIIEHNKRLKNLGVCMGLSSLTAPTLIGLGVAIHFIAIFCDEYEGNNKISDDIEYLEQILQARNLGTNFSPTLSAFVKKRFNRNKEDIDITIIGRLITFELVKEWNQEINPIILRRIFVGYNNSDALGEYVNSIGKYRRGRVKDLLEIERNKLKVLGQTSLLPTIYDIDLVSGKIAEYIQLRLSELAQAGVLVL